MMKKNKNDLRQDLKTQRERFLKTATPQNLSEVFLKHLLEIFSIEEIKPPTAIALYWAKGDEIPTNYLIESLAKDGFQILLPKLKPDVAFAPGHATMDFYLFMLGDSLDAGPFGLMEPKPSIAHIPDVIILPLLGYNKQGHRLGYGKGHYDQTLHALSHEHTYPLTIGLGLSVLETTELTHDPHDIPLDYIINEIEFLKF